MAVTEYYIEHNTNTKWLKSIDGFEPLGEWTLKSRDENDVLSKGVFSGPYKSKGE